MILDEIVGKRKEQLARELQRTDRETMRKLALRTEREVYSFPDALKTGRLSIIAEVKKASPSKSIICADFHPVEQAAAYERAGADAISCLTNDVHVGILARVGMHDGSSCFQGWLWCWVISANLLCQFFRSPESCCILGIQIAICVQVLNHNPVVFQVVISNQFFI